MEYSVWYIGIVMVILSLWQGWVLVEIPSGMKSVT